MMVEDEKGKVKVTIEIEINEGLMGIVTEAMKNIAEMIKNMPDAIPGQQEVARQSLTRFQDCLPRIRDTGCHSIKRSR